MIPTGDLESWLGIVLGLVLVSEHPTIRASAVHIAKQLDRLAGRRGSDEPSRFG